MAISVNATGQRLKTISLAKGKLTADTFVQGSYTATKGDAVQVKWYKVSGFKSSIVTPDSTGTKILSLSKGVYQYGFIVKDITNNLADTDYLKITVQ